MQSLYLVQNILILSLALANIAHAATVDKLEIQILGYNDIHGQIIQVKKDYKDSDGKTNSIFSGGLDVFASYVKRARNVMGNRLLVLDGGDQWQGSLESNYFKGASVVNILNHIGIDASAIGNHEFDFGKDELAKRIGEANFPFIASNLESEDPNFSNLKGYIVKEIDGVKIGIVGLTTLDTPISTVPEYIVGFKFNPLLESIKLKVRFLREKLKVHAVILLVHEGGTCKLNSDDWKNLARTKDDPQSPCINKDNLTDALLTVPRGYVDLVVAGHSHAIIHHWINDIPVISSSANNNYFSMVKLVIDKKEGKVLPDETVIQGPIPICEKVFEGQAHCDPSMLSEAPQKQVRATFLGQEIYPDPEIQQMIGRYNQEVDALKKCKIGVIEDELRMNAREENDMGNFFADALREELGSEMAIVNGGAIRFNWQAGILTFGDLYRSIPFDDSPVVVRMKGSQIYALLQTGTSGYWRLFQVSGLKVKVYSQQIPFLASSYDQNQNGVVDPWEEDRVIEITDEHGHKIEPDAYYRVAITGFMYQGGDNSGIAMRGIPLDYVERPSPLFFRDIIEKHVLDKTLKSSDLYRQNSRTPRYEFVHSLENL